MQVEPGVDGEQPAAQASQRIHRQVDPAALHAPPVVVHLEARAPLHQGPKVLVHGVGLGLRRIAPAPGSLLDRRRAQELCFARRLPRLRSSGSTPAYSR